MAKRRTRWVDIFVNMNVPNNGQNRVSVFADFPLGTFYGSTIVRTIARVGLAPTTVAGAWGVAVSDVGFGVISQESVGAAVFPDPSSALDFPTRGWTFRERCLVSQNGVGTVIGTNCVLDVAAQRKVETGEYYLIVDHATVLGTTFAIQVIGSVRALLLLP